jgi:hypothetical protein
VAKISACQFQFPIAPPIGDWQSQIANLLEQRQLLFRWCPGNDRPQTTGIAADSVLLPQTLDQL